MAKKPTVLIADDEDSVRLLLKEILEEEAFVIEARNGGEAIDIARINKPHVVFLDIRMPGIDGMEALKKIKKLLPNTPVIMLTAYGDANHTITAMKEGAFEYIVKPFDIEDILDIFHKAMAYRESLREVEVLSPSSEPSSSILVGKSDAMKNIFKIIGKIAESPVNILITGESGVGKEHVARSIHNVSSRADKPFIHIPCSAITEETIESGEITAKILSAQGGTVLLDEIGDLSFAAQGFLLPIIGEKRIQRDNEEIPLDIRFIGTSSEDPQKLVEEKKLRKDFLFRLNVVHIHIPPLRERKEDIPELVFYFISKYSKAYGIKVKGITKKAMDLLTSYDYPGNVRELENIIARAIAMSANAYIDVHALPQELGKKLENLSDTSESEEEKGNTLSTIPVPDGKFVSLKDIIKQVEKETIINVLKQCRGNKTEAAKKLGISRQALFKKIKEYGITDEDIM
ncbi:MAG: sigma-54-dependent Fis family transcriptional regulator [Dictyoglomi bacterium]|nr:sigma-54-dependent Fis family transcriptional regulator [Dictyoglomota bacterium]